VNGTQPDRARARLPSVLVVDDHPMVRDVIRQAIEDRANLRIVGESANGVDALAMSVDLSPDVLILDLGLPVMDGFEVIRRLRAEQSPVRILVLSDRHDKETVLKCLRLGVDGYLEKTASVAEIAAAVEAVAAGTRVFSVDHQQAAHEELVVLARRYGDAAKALTSLTRREQQTLGLLAEGLTTRQVGSRLGISERTVESHVRSLYKKLAVSNRVQLITRAAQLKLLSGTTESNRRSAD